MRCLLLIALLVQPLPAWGPRAHRAINRAALEALHTEGLAFLKPQYDYIVFRAPMPDNWRRPSEPFAKMFEDPNHGWFREQFAFLRDIPRSRYEFAIALFKERERIKAKQPELAQLMNIRWTGTLPYAALESYERLQATFRLYRQAKDEQTRDFLAREAAHHIGELGHYLGDGAQPLHVSIHHDGWQGPNPKGYSTDPRIHGKMETAYVDLIALEAADLTAQLGAAQHLADPFASVIAHLDAALTGVELVYQLEKQGAWTDKDHAAARALIYKTCGSAARLLRDMVHTAWLNSATMPPFNRDETANPVSPKHPRYNPETGSAPAPLK
jgi:hypothetical protein